jgi:hypothetical protein
VNTALTGRDGTDLTHAIGVAGHVPPFQGGIRGGGLTQGVSPGLSSCAPPGLHTDRIRAQPYSDNSCLHPFALLCAPPNDFQTAAYRPTSGRNIWFVPTGSPPGSGAGGRFGSSKSVMPSPSFPIVPSTASEEAGGPGFRITGR